MATALGLRRDLCTFAADEAPGRAERSKFLVASLPEPKGAEE